MVCFYPLDAYKAITEVPDGVKKIVFNTNDKSGIKREAIKLPCGQCIGCRLERSRQWAVRCCHEASLHEDNCFITLTYAPEHLPENGTLVKAHFQNFMKKLRNHYISDNREYRQKKLYPEGHQIRYYHCGEYGEQKGRPHYHAILFNHDFPDKELLTIRNGQRAYISKSLSELWPYGIHEIGNVTFESAAYVARYILKKKLGKDSDAYYGEKGIIPEYTTMSRKPGIGYDWFQKYYKDVYPHDYTVLSDGRKIKPPRYYDGLYELTDLESYERIKEKRKEVAETLDCDYLRLDAKRRHKEALLTKLKRRIHE